MSKTYQPSPTSSLHADVAMGNNYCEPDTDSIHSYI